MTLRWRSGGSYNLVTLGERGETNIFITSGLFVGDVVVTEGQQRLSDGAAVETTAL